MRLYPQCHPPRRHRLRPQKHHGAALVETVIALGVLAVAGPLTLAALGQAGGAAQAARAESRAPGIVECCLTELRLAREGRSSCLPALVSDRDFPGEDGDGLVLAFDRQGCLLGRVPAEGGPAEMKQAGAVYLARLTGIAATAVDAPPLLTLTLTLEYPALAAATQRRRLEFVTCLP